VNTVAKIGVSKLSKLERGEEQNPRLRTLERLAEGLSVSVSGLFIDPRPENETGHAGQRETVQSHPGLEALIDTEFPADDSVEGDIHKAIAALARALRRPRATTAPARAAQKTER